MHSLVSTEAAPPGAPAIVLVHGSGLSGQYMIPTARELTPDFRIFVPDMPGYGDSDDPGKVLNVPQLADWLVAWMPAMGLERASFLGNSFGCQVIATWPRATWHWSNAQFCKVQRRRPRNAPRSGNSSADVRTSPITRSGSAT